MRKYTSYVVGAGAALLIAGGAAGDSAEDLARESEAACVESAKVKATPEMVKQKVEEAAALLEKEGPAAFPKFHGRKSPFIYGGTYVTVHDLEGVELVHPVKHKMSGKRLLNLKDANGKLIFVEMDRLCREKGSGWISYVWPKPGGTTPVPKATYGKLVKYRGKEMVVQSGIYDLSEEQIAQLVRK